MTSAAGSVDAGRHLERGVQGHAARAAGEDALGLGEPAGGQEGIAIGHGDPAVDGGAIEGLGQKSSPTPSIR